MYRDNNVTMRIRRQWREERRQKENNTEFITYDYSNKFVTVTQIIQKLIE